MTPSRLAECLSILRWPRTTLAEALGCSPSTVAAWADGVEEIPIKTAAWIEALAVAHAAAEGLKPKVGSRKA